MEAKTGEQSKDFDPAKIKEVWSRSLSRLDSNVILDFIASGPDDITPVDPERAVEEFNLAREAAFEVLSRREL